MRTTRTLGMVVAAALLFAAWQIVNHIYLMNVDMVTYHVIGFLVEAALAAVAILWATHNAEQARRERERAERLAIVVAEAMVSAESDVSPVARLMKGLRELHESAQGMSAIQGKLSRMEQDARRVEVVNRRLRQIISPYVES